jgi:hypothetical protein
VTGGSTGRTATASAEAGAGAGSTSGGLKAAAAPAVSPGMTAASKEGSAWGARPMATRAAWAPRLGASCAEASQPAWRDAALAAEAGTILRAFLGARPAEPCLHLLGGKGKVDQDTRRRSQNIGILRYLPAPNQGQSCLRGGPSGLGPRRRRRGSPRCRLQRRSHFGRPGRRRDGLPMRRHDGPRINLLYGQHGRLLLGAGGSA